MNRPRLSRDMVTLGLVSLCMDTSSEMVHSLLPVFLVGVLGASMLTVGFIEGIAEATASIVKVFSGVLSDRVGRRKPLVLSGYGLAAATKPLFALATGPIWVLAARFIDRVGKGIRGAPRDALIADITPEGVRGAAYGLRQALDTAGAVLGPGVAMVLMIASGDRFRLVFWVAVVPALASVWLIAVGVHEPETSTRSTTRDLSMNFRGLHRLPPAYWTVVAIASVLTLARFSEAFLLLRASDVGLATAYVPLALLAMNVAYAASAYPFGRLSDRIDRHRLLAWGATILALADIVLAMASSVWIVGLGAVLWGVHMGCTQGLLTALVAGVAPADLRGTAFGLLNLLMGLALLLASALAGALWHALGPGMTFAAGAAISALALIGVMAVPTPRGTSTHAPVP